MIIELNKVKFIGEINFKTPRCVIIDICLSVGMEEDYIEARPWRKLLDDLSKIEYVTIDTDEGVNEKICAEMARYINYQEDWNIYNLMEAFFSFINFDPETFIPGKNNFGKKNNNNPKNLDECCLYRLLVHYGISLTTETTFEEMVEKALSISCVDHSLKMFLQKKSTMKKRSWDNIYSYIQNIPSSACEFFHPYNDDEAIVFSAYIYKIDVSLSSDPISEFICLRSIGVEKYSPIDHSFNQMYSLNRDYFNIKRRWNPIFHFMYSKNEIIRISQVEGCKSCNPSECLDYLQKLYMDPTFYIGIHPYTNKTTPIELDDIISCDKNRCVSYGIEGDKKFVTYTFSELISYFETKKYFLDPCSRKVYSEASIKKLEDILRGSYTDEGKTLLSIIRSILKSYKSMSPREVKWISFYENLDDSQKKKCRDILFAIMDLGMYMRGWKITGDKYPLSAQDCMIDVSKIPERDYNITIAYEELEKLTNNEIYSEVNKEISTLPLLQYRDGHFIPSDIKEHGYTLYERLSIVKAGETTDDNIYACIRLSSNYICASCYRYLKLIKENPKFSIKDMREIT
jgi:hypothetical protein